MSVGIGGAALNPERGFSRWIELTGDGPLDAVRAAGSTLGFALVSLASYRARPIDTLMLHLLERGFARARAAGIKVVLRFTYAAAQGEPDAPLARVLEHIGALAPLLADNADVLYVWQAGFVGAWGEWHGSSEGLTRPTAAKAIGAALLEALPAGRYLQVRTPAIKQLLFGHAPLSPERALGPTAAARVGFHNDCVLSDHGDAGTFRSEADRRFMASDARFVPVGGETCRPGPRSEGPDVLRELSRFAYTYLNGDYHPDVIAGWRRSGVYDVLAQRLGYALAVDACSVPETLSPGAELPFEVWFTNVGLAAPTYARPVQLVLQSRHSGRLTVAGTLTLDVRLLRPAQETTRASLVCHAPGLPGTYRVGLALPDPAPRLAARPDYALALLRGAGFDRPVLWENGVSWLADLDVQAP